MAWGSNLVIEETAQQHAPTPAPVFKFTFDASLYPPADTSHVEVAPTASGNEYLEALESAAKKGEEERRRSAEVEAARKRQQQIQLAENTLVAVAGSGGIESARVAAAKILLDRFDVKARLDALEAEIADLKKTKQSEFEQA
jgi:hypothetical protein